jgi:hypothetical protein
VLHTFEELSSTGDQVVRLLQRAKVEQDWDLCKELARFLMALDESGNTLRRTLELVEIKSPGAELTAPAAFTFETATLGVPRPGRRRTNGGTTGLGLGIGYDGAIGGGSGSSMGGSSRSRSPTSPARFAASSGEGDYFGGAGR